MSKFDNFNPHSHTDYTAGGVAVMPEPQTFEEWEQSKYQLARVRSGALAAGGTAPWGIPHIYYNLDMVQRGNQEMVSVESTVLDNSGGTKMEMSTFTYSKARSKGSHEDNDHTLANEVGGEVGSEESFGIPCIDATKVQIKGAYKTSHAWGTERFSTENSSINTAVTAAPGEIVKGEIILTNQKFAVPYKLWKFIKYPKPIGGTEGELRQSFGIFRGESSYALHAKTTLQPKSKINSIAEWEQQKEQTHGCLTAPKGGWENPQIDYNFDLLVRGDTQILSVDHNVVDNMKGGSLPQTIHYTYSEAKSTGTHTDNEINGSLTLGAELEVKEAIKIPLIEETDFSLKVTGGVTIGGSHSWGSEMSTTEEIGVDTEVKAAHGERIQIDSVIATNTFSVPYTLTKSTKGTQYTEAFESYPDAEMAALDLRLTTLGDQFVDGRSFKDFTGITHTSYGVFHGKSGFACKAVYTLVKPKMTNKFIQVGGGYEMVEQPN